MKDRDAPKDQREPDKKEQPYEAPKATVVRVQLEERLLGCLFSSIQVCGLTE
jgi:hypothetical protein